MFGYFTYPDIDDTYNLGDYVQSIAALQHLPREEKALLLNRDDLNNVDVPVNLIMNGWFTHKPEAWPPSESINPLLISFHLNSTAYSLLNSQKNIDFLRKYGPVGCRDYSTERALKARGIECYYSGCLTLTLGMSFNPFQGKRSGIYFVDALFNLDYRTKFKHNWRNILTDGILKMGVFRLNRRKRILNEIFSRAVIDRSETRTHILPSTHSVSQRFKKATEYLEDYRMAELVVTSRIHVALPCIAMGTPVIFLNGGFSHKMDLTRFEGITHLMNRIDIDNNDLKPNWSVDFPLTTKDVPIHYPPADMLLKLKTKVEAFLNENR